MTPTVWHGCFETQREGCVVNQSYSKKLKMGTKKRYFGEFSKFFYQSYSKKLKMGAKKLGILVSFRNFSISQVPVT